MEVQSTVASKKPGLYAGASLTYRYANISDTLSVHVSKMLKDAAVKQAIDYGLVPRTYSSVFDMTGASASKKTLAKLGTLFYKLVAKQIPYLNLADQPLIAQSVTACQIRLGWSEVLTDGHTLSLLSVGQRTKGSGKSNGMFAFCRSIRDHGTSAILRLLTTSIPKDLRRSLDRKVIPGYSMGRYTKLLNRACIRRGIPLRISVAHELWYDNLVFEQLFKMESSREAGSQRFLDLESQLDVRISTVLNVEAVEWRNSSVNVKTLIEQTPPDMLAKVLDGITADESNWGYRAWGSSGMDPGPFKVKGEKVFFFLPQINQVLRTVSRKVKYGPSAFEFKSP